MHDQYYINLVANAERVTEEYTLDRGYQEYPSTQFTSECSTTRWKLREVKSKLGYYYSYQGYYYFQKLEGYERTRWEFEFDRKYEEYTEAMEIWLNLPREFYDYSLSEDVEAVAPTKEGSKSKTFNFGAVIPPLLMLIGLVIFISAILPNNEPNTPQQPTTSNDQ
ncbi:MAG: hypothetical protein HC836_36980 [Richelia sp. RM2_1_2]|nr:hypothetical protein [Richelia sp. RM2_1_2]